jgi:CheY-like chemotaxis protein
LAKEPVEILLVEDNEDDIALTLRAFQRNGLDGKIYVARDGEQATRVLQDCLDGGPDYLPKLVLLDLKLPKVDGFDVLERMKNDPSLRTIPVVVLSSSKEGQDISRCYRLGVNSYIVKPLDFQSFLDAVHVISSYWLMLNLSPKE